MKQIEGTLSVQSLNEGNMMLHQSELKGTPKSKGWHLRAFPILNTISR